jgi:hypothetical protein
MSPPARAAALAAACLALAVTGCGGDVASAPEPPEQPTTVSGYFVGRSDELGASVDFSGFDGPSQAVGDALDPDAPPGGGRVRVGIVSLVSTGSTRVPIPALRAVLASGATVPLVPARRALARLGTAAAVRATAVLPRATAVPAGGSAVAYVVLAGVRLADVTELRMATGGGEPTRLAPESR